MCLIYIAHRVDPHYRLVVAANRDEYHARPAAPAAWWDDEPGILAGRDLEAGGTWMGMSRSGRFAALTNYRDPARHDPGARSRGFLVSGFLRGHAGAMEFLAGVAREGERYNGFSVLVHDGDTLGFYSNRGGEEKVTGKVTVVLDEGRVIKREKFEIDLADSASSGPTGDGSSWVDFARVNLIEGTVNPL